MNKQETLDYLEREARRFAAMYAVGTDGRNTFNIFADKIASCAQVDPLEEEGGRTCETCQGNGEIVTDWERYMHGPLDEKGDDAIAPCPDCEGSPQ